MTFNSWEFLLFYPLVALLYFVLPKKCKWVMLLIASYFFYICYRADLVVLILLTTFVSWGASMLIENTEKRWVKKLCLTVTLIVSLGVLFFYKYFDFLSLSAISLINLFGAQIPPFVLNLALPVGISFYTFQTLSYVIDVYREDIKTERNFFFYALFVSFFPQLVAGPIERPGNLIPQLKETHPWSSADAVKGAKHMLVGFFKKVVVADSISVYVDAVYNNPESATALGVIVATCLFAIQIYCDFSGYTDIAIGCARVMGIRLMKNFDHPYAATSVKEFWARWHISLSTWFRDYLYIPLGGNRCPKWRHLLNLFIVFLVSGLWHGAAWTYVIWGAIHGIYQIVGTMSLKTRNAWLSRMGLSPEGRFVKALRTQNTFLLVAFAWIFFRANSVGDAGLLIKTLFTGWGISPVTALSEMGLTVVPILTTILSILILIFIDRLLTYDDSPDGSDVLTGKLSFVYFIFVIFIAWAVLLSKGMTSTFIYFQF